MNCFCLCSLKACVQSVSSWWDLVTFVSPLFICLFYKLVSFRGLHKLRPRPDWSLLGVKFKISDEHPRPLHMGVPPPREFCHHNIVKVVCGSTQLSPCGSTATLTMLWQSSSSITGQTHYWWCYWWWILSQHCQSSLWIHSAIALWIHSYFHGKIHHQ